MSVTWGGGGRTKANRRLGARSPRVDGLGATVALGPHPLASAAADDHGRTNSLLAELVTYISAGTRR